MLCSTRCTEESGGHDPGNGGVCARARVLCVCVCAHVCARVCVVCVCARVCVCTCVCVVCVCVFCMCVCVLCVCKLGVCLTRVSVCKHVERGSNFCHLAITLVL